MERTELPRQARLRVTVLVDIAPTQPVQAQPELLAAMKKGRSRQSARSRSRQNFFEGVSVYSDPAEKQARFRYLEELRYRIGENEY